jgi:hypothetical protein
VAGPSPRTHRTCSPASSRIVQAIRDRTESRYKISKATGVNESVLSRMVKGTGWVGRCGFDRLAAYLEIEIHPKRGGH